MKTNLYLDCEFDGFGGNLISMALVRDNHNFFYEVVHHTVTDPWVAENVVPVLDQYPISMDEFRAELCNFLFQFPDGVHIIADWPDDIAYFTKALLTGPGTRINTPPLTMEIVRSDHKSLTPHNALADALGIWRDLCASL